MNLPAKNYFETYGLPVSFELDPGRLRQTHRKLMSEAHPDRFSMADAITRRQAATLAANYNEAFNVLSQPLGRARHLLELAGVDTEIENETIDDPEFLFQQLELREKIERAGRADQPESALDSCRQELDRQLSSMFDTFQREYESGDFSAARDTWRKAHFFGRMKRQIVEEEEALEES